MSVNISVGSFTSQADKQRKMRDYKKYLQLRSKVNAQAQVANDTWVRNFENNVEPAPTQYKSTEEELQDLVNQRQIVLDHLKTIMKAPDAVDVANSQLKDLTELNLLNTHWEKFKKEIGGRKFIRSVDFKTLWDRFKALLDSTQSTGITIPLNEEKLDEQLRQMANVIIKKAMETGISPVHLAQLQQNLEARVQGQDVAGLEQLSGMRRTQSETRLPQQQRFVLPSIAPITKEWTPDEEEAFALIEPVKGRGQDNARRPLNRTIFAPKFGKTIKLWLNDQAKVKYGLPPNSIKEQWDAIAQAKREAYARGQLGLGIKKKYGRGIAENQTEKYRQFGRYVVDTHNLKNNILAIRYQHKKAQVPTLQTRRISDTLRDLIMDVLDTGRVNFTHYNNLSSADRELFHRAAHHARIDETLGLKATPNSDNDDMRRFEILRGELIAGNDAKQVRDELRKYVLKFMADGRLPRGQAQGILWELAILEKN